MVAKAPQKLYPQIRKLLITYALSRPDVRFSFRILDGPKKVAGKSENWVYAPSKVVQEAVTKIIGKEISSNCIWQEFDTSENEDDMHFDPEGMKVEALLIKSGAGELSTVTLTLLTFLRPKKGRQERTCNGVHLRRLTPRLNSSPRCLQIHHHPLQKLSQIRTSRQ